MHVFRLIFVLSAGLLWFGPWFSQRLSRWCLRPGAGPAASGFAADDDTPFMARMAAR